MPIKAKLITAAVLVAFILGAGYWLRGLQEKATMVAEVQEQARADKAQADRASSAVQETEVAKTKTEIRYVTVTKEVEKLVERPVYLQQCFDDDGLRVLNAQIRGSDPAQP